MEKEQKVEIRKTITSIFMVPTLRIDKENLMGNNFLNGYISDKMHENMYEDSVFALFRPTNLDKFKEFLDGEYERVSSILEDYDYPNGFVIIVYKLDAKFATDFALVKEGMYSRTSSAFQNEFPKTVKVVEDGQIVEKNSLQYMVFNKSKKLIEFWEGKFGETFDEDQEIWNGFQKENETLTEDKLREYEQQNY